LNPIITLSTDFGTKDPYVGAIKGVLLSELPTATIIDLTHELDIFEPCNALPFLKDTITWFPPESFHLVIVDPGVGSDRTPLQVQSPFGWIFLPDNGLPALMAEWFPNLSFRKIPYLSSQPAKERSPTFQARDLFAKALIQQAKAKRGTLLGEALPPESLTKSFDPPPSGICRVWNIDHFGNILLGYHISDPPRQITLPDAPSFIPYVRFYQDVAVGELGILVNSSGWLEIFKREGSAENSLKLKSGDRIRIHLEGGKYKIF
jgi:hypothetical protein